MELFLKSELDVSEAQTDAVGGNETVGFCWDIRTRLHRSDVVELTGDLQHYALYVTLSLDLGDQYPGSQ